MENMKKYKPSVDIPRYAVEFKTDSPIELSRIIWQEKHIKRTPESIIMWFKRHPEDHTQLLKVIKTSPETQKEMPEPCAKLTTNNYGSIEITDLESLKTAREKLALIEEDLKSGICEKANLDVFIKKSHDR